MNKKMTAVLAFLLAALMLLAGCGREPVRAIPTTGNGSGTAAPDEVTNESAVHPLLWEVDSKDGRGHVYLFGSIHVADETLYPLPDAVENAFAESDSLAVEFDTTYLENDVSLQMEMLNSMLLKDGETIRDIMDDELYNEVKDFLIENGTVYSELYDAYNGYFWSSLIDEILLGKTPLKSDFGVDRHFLTAAHERDMEIIDIESMEFQLEMLNSVPDELQMVMIESSLEYQDSYGDDLLELYDAYCEGDEEKLVELSKLSADEEDFEDASPEEIALLIKQINAYNDALLTKRNIGMADAAMAYLESGKNVFLVVGTAHMVGEDGIAALLRDAGYNVKQINY